MKNVILIIISLFFMMSCDTNNDCETIIPPESTIDLRILDTEGNSLIGENNIYKPSEIMLTRGDQEILLIFNEYNEETYIKLNYPEMESEKDYQLKLNDQETDILKLKLENIEGKCYDILSVETFSLNGEEIQFDSDSYSYIIRK